MKIIITGNTSFKLANFRESLIRRLVQDSHELIALAPEDSYTEKLRRLGCRFIPLFIDRKGKSITKELYTFFNFVKIFSKTRPDIVLGFTIKNNLYGSLASKLLNIPFIPNVTGLGPAFAENSYTSQIITLLYRYAFRRHKVVFFQNSNDIKIFLANDIIKHNQARLLPGSGINLKTFVPCDLPSKSDDVTFLFIARLIREKGVKEFIDAARRFKISYPRAKFQILGPFDDGNKSVISRDYIISSQSSGVIQYLGETNNVIAHISQADCIVLPSYYKEGTPRSLLEAAAMGRPIITTNMPGCRDTVIDRVTGFICEPRNVEDLLLKLTKFIELDPASRSKMGLMGRQLMESKFNEEFVISAYYAALNEYGLIENEKNVAT